MNQTDVMIKIVEMAKLGGALPVDEAISLVATMINQLDGDSEHSSRDVERLLKIGATIWDLHSGPRGAHQPGWVPPFLRPQKSHR